MSTNVESSEVCSKKIKRIKYNPSLDNGTYEELLEWINVKLCHVGDYIVKDRKAFPYECPVCKDTVRLITPSNLRGINRWWQEESKKNPVRYQCEDTSDVLRAPCDQIAKIVNQVYDDVDTDGGVNEMYKTELLSRHTPETIVWFVNNATEFKEVPMWSMTVPYIMCDRAYEQRSSKFEIERVPLVPGCKRFTDPPHMMGSDAKRIIIPSLTDLARINVSAEKIPPQCYLGDVVEDMVYFRCDVCGIDFANKTGKCHCGLEVISCRKNKEWRTERTIELRDILNEDSREVECLVKQPTVFYELDTSDPKKEITRLPRHIAHFFGVPVYFRKRRNETIYAAIKRKSLKFDEDRFKDRIKKWLLFANLSCTEVRNLDVIMKITGKMFYDPNVNKLINTALAKIRSQLCATCNYQLRCYSPGESVITKDYTTTYHTDVSCVLHPTVNLSKKYVDGDLRLVNVVGHTNYYNIEGKMCNDFDGHEAINFGVNDAMNVLESFRTQDGRLRLIDDDCYYSRCVHYCANRGVCHALRAYRHLMDDATSQNHFDGEITNQFYFLGRRIYVYLDSVKCIVPIVLGIYFDEYDGPPVKSCFKFEVCGGKCMVQTWSNMFQLGVPFVPNYWCIKDARKPGKLIGKRYKIRGKFFTNNETVVKLPESLNTIVGNMKIGD